MLSELPIKISNIKLSVKIKAISASALKNLCDESNVEYKDCVNFIIFKLAADGKNEFKYQKKNVKRLKGVKKHISPQYYTYGIFKPKCEKQEKIHTNICGLKEGQIEKAINKLQVFLKYPPENIAYEIDTVTGTTTLKHRINLREFLKNNLLDSANKIKFNPEAFPALYCTRDKITYSLFSSGCINIVGAKSREDIESKIEYILQKCLESASTKLNA